eukprot:5621942-Pyramimonas_sp.AAC.1
MGLQRRSKEPTRTSESLRLCIFSSSRSGWPPRLRGGIGTDTATLASFWLSWASWEALVATAGFSSKFLSERTPGGPGSR